MRQASIKITKNYKMKKRFIVFTLIAFTILNHGFSQTAEPWKAEQLLAPATLNSSINSSSKDKPLILCVGPSALIKTSVDAGPAKDKDNLEQLKQILSREKKDRPIVIYCGCCPFDHCPNVRPAFQLLNEMQFTHAMLLDIPKNLKTDWIDKGYSINQ
jgi:hypothetical protein